MKKLLLAGFASILSISAAQAIPLNTNQTITTSDGSQFSNFSCTATAQGSNTAGNCGTLSVVAFGASGIEFQGQIQAASGASTSSLDILLGYNVARANPPLSSVNLTFNGAIVPTGGNATAQITETAFTAQNGTLLGQTIVATPGPLSSTLNLTPSQTSLFLRKDIVVTAFANTTFTTATISFVDQNFPGGGTPVPEPVSLALLGAGLVGLGLVRQAKRS